MRKVGILLLLSLYSFTVTAYSKDIGITSDSIVGSHEAVRYKVSQNQGNIMVQISTQDNKTMMTMLRHGVTVFFDLKGKEKENVAVTYPVAPVRMPMKPEGDRQDEPQSEAEISKVKAELHSIVTEDFPEEAEFQFYDSKQPFNVLINSMGISATYTYNEKENLLIYNLTIPKDKIKEKAKNDLSKLLIGVQTVKPDRSKKAEGSTNIDGSMGPRGGGRGNRPEGGSGGRRGGGGRPQGDQQDRGENRSKAPAGIDFWFEAHM
ncbi:hypothetical protein [Pseudotamlana agarivorans]|uniref:hypothetical protein n=1 Tax=Pseudotamlana agarivorans TaxID=481183 RepID=UPI000833DC2D|nr:hypothetical protein [Tamlana agarivorans]